jgi:hypothetical protein
MKIKIKWEMRELSMSGGYGTRFSGKAGTVWIYGDNETGVTVRWGEHGIIPATVSIEGDTAEVTPLYCAYRSTTELESAVFAVSRFDTGMAAKLASMAGLTFRKGGDGTGWIESCPWQAGWGDPAVSAQIRREVQSRLND